MSPAAANWEFFQKDPRSFTLLNDGVAKIRPFGENATEQDWKALRHELETFVCEGEYRAGLDRILSTFFGHIDLPTQPAVWVSGFFGSGKSHFVRVLEALWRDVVFPGGQTARDIAMLPEEIRDQLRELTTEGRRAGGLWSASGMANQSHDQSFTMMLLGTVFESAGLSSGYGQARFHLWLRREGWEDRIADLLRDQGRDFQKELNVYLASTSLAAALLACNPDLGETPIDVLDRIASQFPDDRTSLDLREFTTALEEVLASVSTHPGRRPLTLIVLDEMQQYIGDDSARSLQVQQTVEAISSHFGGSVMFVGTGQAAMHGTPNLQKLRDRFTTRVTLSDTDVEQVVRKVVLNKRPERIAQLDQVLQQAAGEIDRQLRDTRIGPRSEDRSDLVADYPLLPTRRRLWEKLLVAIDASGTSGQLRTQLRVTLEATRSVTEKSVGHVIPGDNLFDQLSGLMAQSGVLPREVLLFINRLNDGTEDGRLRSRLCGLIFLIGSLPRGDLLSDTGVRATAETLADLIVEDLTVATPELRGRIPVLLQELTTGGQLLRSPSGEYSIQTGDSLQWEKDFQHHVQSLTSDLARMAEMRGAALKRLVEADIKKIRRTQGTAAVAREVKAIFGQEAPPPSPTSIAIWVRDGWDTQTATVVEDARQQGPTSPTIFVHLPQKSAKDLDTALARAEAAAMTINQRGAPSTDTGRAALANMRNREAEELANRDRILADIVASARVLHGGGTDVDGAGLAQMLQNAFDASALRMFDQFALADNPKWENVFTRAKAGAGDALTAVNDRGEALENPVVKRVQTAIGGEPGRTWADVRAHFAKEPFGWSQQAVDGSVALLVLNGTVRASRDGKPLNASELSLSHTGQTRLVGESVVVTKSELLKVRGLLPVAGLQAKDDDETRARVGTFVTELRARATAAGGIPPAPLPVTPAYLTELEGLSGAQLLKALSERADEIARDAKAWARTRETIDQRMSRWRELKRLEAFAEGVPGLDDVRAGIAAIERDRLLVAEPDPIPALTQQLAGALRDAVNASWDELETIFENEEIALHATSEWPRIDPAAQAGILSGLGLAPETPPSIASTAELLAALQAEPLPALRNRIEALPGRFDRAHEQAAKLLEPAVVSVQIDKPMLRSEDELDAWLGKIREQLAGTIRGGNPAKVV